ncbi:hypothetical protein [Huintestinicola sp.]|uniref:hypothetical protein n=1 Tax=Huintestinicola sp. TaxID=2981661 RepID=UPI003D7E1C7E
MAKPLSEQIFNDILKYTNDVKKKAHSAALDIEKQMVKMAENASPVREYPKVVKRITVRRSPGSPKAVKVIQPERYQPGYFKKGWVTGTIKTKSGRLYAARNKNMPTVTHLLNFDHKLITHRVCRGVVYGTHFVEKIQDWGERELDRRLSEFLENDD